MLKKKKLHLGCGKNFRPGFINCDIQEYPGVDKVMDCSNLSCFSDDSVELIYTNAFFEHLYFYQQMPFLDHCFRIMNNDGVLIILGIPDFEEIARCYIEKSPMPAFFGDHFGLYCAYRLTHGDCECGESVSIPQMHKMIFDKAELNTLFSLSKFKNFQIFGYTFRKEKYPLALGVVARKNLPFKDNEVKNILRPFDSIFDNLEHSNI